MTVEERFWNKVAKRSAGECWEWRGKLHPDGYAQFRVDGIETLVHRFSWELHYGAIPKEMCVLHRCDKPSCVNPNHLFLGTQKDNMQDASHKGRLAKVSNGLVKNVHYLYTNSSWSMQDVADFVGISIGTVWAIVNKQDRYKEALRDD